MKLKPPIGSIVWTSEFMKAVVVKNHCCGQINKSGIGCRQMGVYAIDDPTTYELQIDISSIASPPLGERLLHPERIWHEP